MKKKLALLLALVLAIGAFAGCAGKKTEEGDITLKWYARINKEPDSAEVFQMVSDMAKEKIGAAIDIIALEDYSTKIGVINASGEDFDIVYTSSVVNNIYKNVADGNLLALDDLLPKYAPELWKDVDADVWEGVKINGKIYGIPNQQIFARSPGFMIPTQNFAVLGIDPNKKYEKLADYEDYFKAIKAKTGTYGYMAHGWGGDGAQREGFELLAGSEMPGAIRYNEENPVVVNQYESQEYKDYIALRRRWVVEGLTAPMEMVETDLSKYLAPEGEVVPWLITLATNAPGVESDYIKNYDLKVTVTTPGTPLLNTYGLVATMASVNIDTRYPEKSVEFLNLLNTDPEIYNLMVYGIEGKNYTKLDNGYVELSKENSYNQPAWAIGNTFNGYLREGQQADVHEATKLVNRNAKRSPVLGFTPDQEPIKVYIANCKAVKDEFAKGLDQGIVDIETAYPAFIEKLKAAGADEIVKELNRQLDEWRKNK